MSKKLVCLIAEVHIRVTYSKKNVLVAGYKKKTIKMSNCLNVCSTVSTRSSIQIK